MRRKLVRIVLFSLLLSLPTLLPAKAGVDVGSPKDYAGDYQTPSGQVIGIDRFASENGQITLLYSEYSTGHVRRMYAGTNGKFVIGPAFGIDHPREKTIVFLKNEQGAVTGVVLKASDGKEQTCQKMPIEEQEISFKSGDATLSGTLLIPPGSDARPAIILLHGSGLLTRYSFGPYPHFFTSLGLAVLVYDKRGAGASTGQFMTEASYYPNGFTDDALAAFRYLQSRKDIDARKIGLWGTSEGGMLTTQVASRNNEVRFIIDSSGFMMPLSEQLLYKVKAQLQADGFPPDDIAAAGALQRERLNVERTGEGYKEFQALREKSKDKKWFFLFSDDPTSLDDMRWQWSHVYAFDPLPALKKVSCPVLGVFGALDVYTEANAAAANLRNVLSSAGNERVMVKVFPNANHALVEVNSGRSDEFDKAKGQVPGLFPLLSDWIRRQVSNYKATVGREDRTTRF